MVLRYTILTNLLPQNTKLETVEVSQIRSFIPPGNLLGPGSLLPLVGNVRLVELCPHLLLTSGSRDADLEVSQRECCE